MWLEPSPGRKNFIKDGYIPNHLPMIPVFLYAIFVQRSILTTKLSFYPIPSPFPFLGVPKPLFNYTTYLHYYRLHRPIPHTIRGYTQNQVTKTKPSIAHRQTPHGSIRLYQNGIKKAKVITIETTSLLHLAKNEKKSSLLF